MASIPESSPPESNLHSVVRDLNTKKADLDGSGLVEIFRVLLERAEECRRIRAHSAKLSDAMLTGKEPITQELVSEQCLATIYERKCLMLFLARACRALADDLEYDLFEDPNETLKRIKRVVYSASGEIESFELEKL
jgi:hypothetical protein